MGSKSWQLKSFTAFDHQRIRLASGGGADRVGGTNDRGCCQRRAMSDLSWISSTDKLALCHIFHIKGNLYFVSGTFSQWLNICLWKVGRKVEQTGIQVCATLGETETRGFFCIHACVVCVCGCTCTFVLKSREGELLLRQGLSLTLESILSQVSWKPAGSPLPSIYVYLWTEVTNTHKTIAFLCESWDPNSRPTTAQQVNYGAIPPVCFVVSWSRRLD